MKKLILNSIALAVFGFPLLTSAAVSVPWVLQNMSDAYISPALVNGVARGAVINAASGISTTSPFGLFAIQANNGGTNIALFSIGSSTAAGNTTLFSVINTGTLNLNVDPATSTIATLGGRTFITASSTGQNTSLGIDALGNVTSGNKNTAIGYQAGDGQTTRIDSVYVGYLSGHRGNSSDSACVGFMTCGAAAAAGMTGLANNAFGSNSLTLVTTGNFNVAFGGALNKLTTGTNNVSLGISSLSNLLGGSGNIAVGNNTGQGLLANESNNILIGKDTASTTHTGSHNIMIGHDLALVDSTASNYLDIGNLIFGINLTSQASSTPQGQIGIASTTPWGVLSVQSANDPLFVLATSSGNMIGGYDNDGHIFTSGPAGTVSSCGTGTGTVVGDDQGGTITTATAATACTLTFSKAYKNTPYCTVTDNSLIGFADIASISTTAVTFGISSALTGGLLYFQCSYHR